MMSLAGSCISAGGEYKGVAIEQPLFILQEIFVHAKAVPLSKIQRHLEQIHQDQPYHAGNQLMLCISCGAYQDL
jgi:hypothetical protein